MKKMLYSLAIFMHVAGILHATGSSEFTPTGMTPLVGPGCVINQIDKSLVEAVAGTSDLDYIVDTNPQNYASFSSLLSADVAYTPTVSVRDMNRTFSAGTVAGFVIQSSSATSTNLLTADILKMFWVETYLDGIRQEGSKDSQSSGGSFLDLNLLTVAPNGKTKIAVTTTKPFDEIRLSVSGIDVNVLTNLKIYYAYAGENPVTPVTVDYYKNAKVHASGVTGIGNAWTTAIWNWPSAKNNLVGPGSENAGVGFGTLTNLLTEPRVTIDAGQTIPAGTEVGFLIESGSALAINLLKNTILTTYDAKDNEVETKTIISVLGLGVAGGGKTYVSMITTAPCTQVKIQFGGLNIDVGGTKIFYAFTRPTDLLIEEQCSLKLSADVTVCTGTSAQLSGTPGVLWTLSRQPYGANASVNSSGLVRDMTVPGDYIIRAELGACTDSVTITKSPVSNISSDCNRPIVNLASPFKPKGGGCLLCLGEGTSGDLGNLFDDDLNNFVEYTNGLSLAANTSVIGVGVPIDRPFTASADVPRRVGFVMQATSQFLNANVLKFFVIKTYLDGKEQESSLVEENNAISANLIGGTDSKMRYSFVAEKPFNQVALWTAGVLNLSLNKFRIYYAFEEPVTDDCLAANGANACVTMLSSKDFGAQIAYNHTGFNGVANVGAYMVNLSNALDGNRDSYALINKVAGIGGSATLAVKVNRIIENGYQAGFILKDLTWLTNVDLLTQVKIRTYLNGVATGDETGTPQVLSLNLIGAGDVAYLSVIPSMPFDELQLDLSGLVDAAINTRVYGAFIRKDTDGDGIPDCIDPNPCGEELVVKLLDYSCVGQPVSVSIRGGKDDAVYQLWNGVRELPFTTDVVTFNAPVAGRTVYTVRENGTDVYDIAVAIHDTLTTWTGKNSTDWNDWDNWTNGIPSGCTNVVLPSKESLNRSAGTHYPVLEDRSEQGVVYVCDGIHFEPGAELVHPEYLVYEKAWVEVRVPAKVQNMVSIPLHDTYSGDLFIGGTSQIANTDSHPRFTPLVGEVRRSAPRTTSRIWVGDKWKNTDAIVTPLNSGFSMAAVVTGSSFADTTHFVYRFAKEDTVYNYFNLSGGFTDKTGNTPRSSAVGRLLSSDGTGKPQTFNVNLSNETTGHVFVVGNPFPCHLNVSRFIAGNEGLKDFVKVYDGNSSNASILYNNTLVSLSATDTTLQVAPTEAFFVETATDKTDLTVYFTPDMMEHGIYDLTFGYGQPKTRSVAVQEGDHSLDGNAALKVYSRNGEGVVESNEMIRNLRVYTVTGNLILERQNVPAPVYFPLSEGVNAIKIQTDSEMKIFKLIK